jgi:hypothetical protein
MARRKDGNLNYHGGYLPLTPTLSRSTGRGSRAIALVQHTHVDKDRFLARREKLAQFLLGGGAVGLGLFLGIS